MQKYVKLQNYDLRQLTLLWKGAISNIAKNFTIKCDRPLQMIVTYFSSSDVKLIQIAPVRCAVVNENTLRNHYLNFCYTLTTFITICLLVSYD